MKQTEIRKIKKGEFFRLKDSKTAPVWVREDYNRSIKKYESNKYEDFNHWGYFKGNRKVYIDFIY